MLRSVRQGPAGIPVAFNQFGNGKTPVAVQRPRRHRCDGRYTALPRMASEHTALRYANISVLCRPGAAAFCAE